MGERLPSFAISASLDFPAVNDPVASLSVNYAYIIVILSEGIAIPPTKDQPTNSQANQ